MNKFAAIPLIASLAFAGSVATSATDFNQIMDAAVFTQIVVDKPLVRNASTTFTINADGTMGGVYNGRELAGTWEWVGDAFCRTLTTPRRNYSCQKVTTNGTDARFLAYPNSGMNVVLETVARNN